MPTDVTLTIIAVVTTLVFLGIVFIIILVYYSAKKKKMVAEKRSLEIMFRQEILQTQLETQEHSFNQISEELHDNIGQLLSSTKLLLGISEINVQKNNLSNVSDTLQIASQTLGKAIQDLRSLSKSLNQEWLHRFNLLENLQTEVDRINAARQVQVQLSSHYQKLPLEPEGQVMLFRVVQEALQNCIKHAEARNISIDILDTTTHFTVTIRDDGKGFSIDEQRGKSLGLRNMEHRTRLLNGTIEWKTGEGGGCLLMIQIPVDKEPVN